MCSLYVYESIYSVVFYWHRHDTAENICHHMATLALVGCAYVLNWWDYTGIIIFLNISSDIGVSLMRVAYFRPEKYYHWVSFLMMLGGFLYLRDFLQVAAQLAFHQ